jgi:hypothetical protein
LYKALSQERVPAPEQAPVLVLVLALALVPVQLAVLPVQGHQQVRVKELQPLPEARVPPQLHLRLSYILQKQKASPITRSTFSFVFVS